MLNNIAIVYSFNELMEFEFSGKINAVCWDRVVEGDFDEIVSQLKLNENITEISIDELNSLNLSENGLIARNIIINDLTLLENWGTQPSLNLLKQYEQDKELDFISTDVYSFHVDRSPILVDTFLCTYFGASSEIISNDYVELMINNPEVRKKLYALYDGPDNLFEEFLVENYFDMHYQVNNHAKVYNLGIGKIWRLAVDHPDQKVLPCVHRAPKENPNELRLLLIS